MKKEIYYTYLGENGTLTTTIRLEGIYSIKKYKLFADEKKLLTKDGKTFMRSIMIPVKDLDLWYEVDEI